MRPEAGNFDYCRMDHTTLPAGITQVPGKRPENMRNSSILTTSGLIGALSLVLLLGFATEAFAQSDRDPDDLPLLDLDRPIRLNFSGDWEKDFNRSDRWEDELNRLFQIRQERAASQRAGVTTRNVPRTSLGNLNLNSLIPRGTNIVDLARLAEYVSRQTTIHIEQDRNEVRIERRGEAPLICSIEDGLRETFRSEHGNEFCGWDGQQLVFITSLPDDLEISHRFDVAADREEPRMVTSISYKGSAPFNLIQAFNRYDAGIDNLNCVLTVTRGRVCSQVTPLGEDRSR